MLAATNEGTTRQSTTLLRVGVQSVRTYRVRMPCGTFLTQSPSPLGCYVVLISFLCPFCTELFHCMVSLGLGWQKQRLKGGEACVIPAYSRNSSKGNKRTVQGSRSRNEVKVQLYYPCPSLNLSIAERAECAECLQYLCEGFCKVLPWYRYHTQTILVSMSTTMCAAENLRAGFQLFWWRV